MEELYERLCELEEKHTNVKNDIYDARVAVQLQKEGRYAFNRGRVAELLINYKNELDQIKREVNEALKIAKDIKIDKKQKDHQTLF